MPSRSTTQGSMFTRLSRADLALKRVLSMKEAHTAACMTAGSACVAGMALAGMSGRPVLAVAFALGLSLVGLVSFFLDIRA
jgi:hypothetical protein